MSKELSTKEKIIKAAKKLFLQHGFAGVSMGQIRDLAGVTHSLLFYHFKNKENLWVEVKQSIIDNNKNIAIKLPSGDLKFRDFLHEVLKGSIDFYRSNSDFVRMINWQRLESQENPIVGIGSTEIAKEFINLLHNYQKKNEIRGEIKLEYLVTMINSITNSVVLDNYTFISDQHSLKEYIDFCCDSIVRMVSN